MKAIRTGAKPSTLDALEWVDIDAAAAPGPGEITVDLKASSLNYHDYAVVKGMIPTEPGRIPMSDGAGIVSAVGDGVTEFAVGDQVVSTFFPDGLDGLRAVVNPLPDHQREVVFMRFLDDMSLNEIALALGIPLGTVKSRLHHAVGALREDPICRAYFDIEP